MKKELLLIAFALVTGGAAMGQTKSLEITKTPDTIVDYNGIQSSNATTTKTTFYGSKASNHANNPCKGATTRVCGTIETIAQQINIGLTKVTQTTIDCDGIVKTRVTTTDKTPKQVQNLILEATTKGAEAKQNTDE